MNNDQQNFQEWAILELFGHQRIAGLVTAVSLGGASFVRVDVPDVDKEPGAPSKLTKILNPSAIYAITPVTEETARAAAKSCSAAPVTRWDVQEIVDRAVKDSKRSLQSRIPDDQYEEDMPV